VAAQQSLSGINPPPVELRRGKLACDDPLRQVRLPLQTAIISVALLMLILAGSFLFRAHRYDELSRSAESQQLESFKSALPNQMPPPLITSRLISEEKRLEGLRGVRPPGMHSCAAGSPIKSLPSKPSQKSPEAPKRPRRSCRAASRRPPAPRISCPTTWRRLSPMPRFGWATRLILKSPRPFSCAMSICPNWRRFFAGSQTTPAGFESSRYV